VFVAHRLVAMSIESGQDLVQIVLLLQPGAEPQQGQVGLADGRQASFTGWSQLASAIQVELDAVGQGDR
jgi:hypothetical protein